MTTQKYIISTPCYSLREIDLRDAQQILVLTNDPDWLKYIGDRSIYSHDNALTYIQERFIASYQAYGFGSWAIIDNETGAFMGICGLLQREAMAFPELGYALLPEYRGRGVIQALIPPVLEWAKQHEVSFLTALTTPDNHTSIHILEKHGFTFSRIHFEEGNSLNVYQRML
ncbi:MAG: GNAT family N-acetyltransferase [Alteromonadaceae bacterium]|nr:GNAT family N-acetyltransferase [Alteromonadaceae bacterium]